MKEKNNCDNCGKDKENLYGKSKYNGNIDDGFYCRKCYYSIHGELVVDEKEDEK